MEDALYVLLGAMSILLAFVLVLFVGLHPPVKFINKDTYINYLNLKHQSELIFYLGVVDAYSNLIAKKYVCRAVNVYKTVLAVVSSNATKFYLILDDNHIRGYFNGTFYDITNPFYKFHPENTTIIECTLQYTDTDIEPQCNIVYADGVKVPGADIDKLLERLFYHDQDTN